MQKILLITFVLVLSLFNCCGCFAQTELDNTNTSKKVLMLGHGNVATLRGVIEAKSTSNFLSELMKVESEEIVVYMITPGGSVTHGHQIINAIEALSSSGKHVSCVGDVVNSMGFAILQACPHRYVRTNSILMQHQMSLGMKGQIENIRSRMKFIDQLEAVIEKIQYERLNMTPEEFSNLIMNDWWIYGEKAVENSVADEIVNVLCSRELVTETYTDTVYTIFGSIDLVFSKCPLIWDPLEFKLGNNSTELLEYFNDNKDQFMISEFIEKKMDQ